MTMNPFLKKMGFSPQDKVLVVHADDVGITQSSIDAFLELTDFGTVSSGSTMVPAPWLPAVAKMFQANPTLDLGIHLVLNCEYETYRWRPVSNVDENSGLIDENGYFKQDSLEVIKSGNRQSIEDELEAQIRVAQNLGIKPTHVDTHSGTAWAGKFIESYLNIYEKHKILPVTLNLDNTQDPMIQGMMKMLQISPESTSDFATTGLPLIDSMAGLPVNEAYDLNDRLALAKNILDGVQPGKLTHFAFHPMKDTPESRGLKRYSEGRIGDYEVFMKKELKDHLVNSGIQLIGYKDIIKHI